MQKIHVKQNIKFLNENQFCADSDWSMRQNKKCIPVYTCFYVFRNA